MFVGMDKTTHLKKRYNEMAKKAKTCPTCKQRKKLLAAELTKKGVKVPKTYFRIGK